VDFSALAAPEDQVAVIATTPLTDNETWTAFTPGTLMLFENGEPVLSATTQAFEGPKSASTPCL
jgi:glutamine amidotransferase